ncbi:hypothetical protein DAPPUDRAFT_118253 [Daphnia pulex]|uniref:Paraneoplastic antigen Ma-like C-terminal domain-containing protein n=1 Tax=Daphnia pulex TaxID=6669 RepID=E9HV67_DAPPU|nr:hypothetical protein DAPPUDRAFT_118253 [Daphnia pulex]|eukprot:EFX64363.1 hypothetical protein DAPPUDRAFT_118253 [Daphnia pulex]
MLNNDVFGSRPKLVRTPIISVFNPLYNVVEVEIHAPPVSPIPSNSVVSDCQESFANIVDSGSAKLIQDPVRKIQGSTDKELRTRVYSEIQKNLDHTPISSGTNRNSDSKNSRRSNTRAECSLSESSSSTSIFNPSFEELRGKKDRLSKKQSSSLDAITSVIPEYSGVGHRVGADRSISGDEVSRDNNRIIEIPTRANPARAERSKRTSPGKSAVDGRRRLSHGSSRNWRSVLLRARKFYKFTRQFSEKYSSPLHVSELSLQIGTSTITQSGAIGNTQAGADQSIEQIKSASPSQEVLTQNIYPGVRIIDQENEEEFEEINFISSFSFRGTSPESEQAEPSGQSKQVRESISPEPEKTITKEQTLDGIFADFGESRNSTTTNKRTKPIESIDYRDRNQKQHRKIPSTPQTSPKRSARIEDFCLLSNTNLITKMNTDTTPKFAAASDLSAFQKDQYVRSSLQSLSSFSGGALQRFDTWLETFEAIMYDSDMTEKDTILELYKKMTDKAHRTMKYILHSGNDRFEAIKEKLLDHFHGDETTEKSLKKFKKANRKSGEKIYDFAIRLKELFRYAYPKNYEEDSFQIIIKEKLIDGIDEKLQMKVKYKEFRTFDELVAATRKYSVSMEAFESNKERHEFVNAINQTSHPNNSEIQEIKQIVREQHETVNAIASALKQGNKQAEETATDQSEIANCIQELSKAVSFLLTKDGKQQHVQKQKAM